MSVDDSPEGGGAVENELARRLEHLLTLAGVSRPQMTSILSAAGMDPRTIDSWFDKPKIKIRMHTASKIIECFKTFGVHVEVSCLTTDKWSDFLVRDRELLDGGRRKRVRSVQFSDNFNNMTQAELSNLCGTHSTYRFSFSGDRHVAIEVLTIERVPNNKVELDVTMYCNNVHDKSHERQLFRGTLFRFGDTYNIIASYSDSDGEDRRIRYLQFPTYHAHEDTRYGLITGRSVALEEPVCGRIIMKRMETPASFDLADPNLTKRVAPDDEEVRPYIDMLEKDVHDREPYNVGQRLMTVSRFYRRTG